MGGKQVQIAVAGSHSSRKDEVQRLLGAAGLKGISCKSVSALYRLEGDVSPADAGTVAQQLLCDAVVEKYSIDGEPSDKSVLFVDVWYKPGVTDAAGDSVLKAIADLNVSGIEKAYAGTRYEFFSKSDPKSAEKALREFSNKELLNPLVQECKILAR